MPNYPEFDPMSNPSDNTPFKKVVAHRLARRRVLAGGVASVSGFLGLSAGFAGAAAANSTERRGRHGGGAPLLGFTSVPASDADTVAVPEGYTAQVLIPWGQPLRSSGPVWEKDASNTADEQAEQVGMHHDGMHFFPLGRSGAGNRRGLLAVNHEYIDRTLLYADGDEVMTPEKVAKALAGHGATVVEIELVDGAWQVVDSDYNRRIHGTTPMTISGPVPGDHPALQSNNEVMGTLNNCANGHTPWNTYLTCEENFHGYFGTGDPAWAPTPEEDRYGLSSESDYRWFEADPRFDLAVNRNEPNRFGWVVEIDPFDPTSTPVKRTALGRCRHEGATVTEVGGRLVVYLGDDQDGEYLYKYVSSAPWRLVLAEGKSPLDDGTLYAAQYNDDGTGAWLPLVFGDGPLTSENGWADQADVLLRTREAADAVGATPLDRAEWIAVHPHTGVVYAALTNGTGWESKVNPRTPNPYGHIISWREDRTRGKEPSTTFEWDIFVLAGDPAYDDQVELDETNIFGSPDGLWVDPDGRLWIQTDVSNSSQLDPAKGYDNIGNNQMLAADPATGEIRRFLVGPRGCEITGVTTTPDQRTMFVNVQHPGEDTPMVGESTPEDPQAVSSWPDHDPAGRPRAATVVIRKLDGGVIGT